MDVDEQALRAVIRDAVSRHLSGGRGDSGPSGTPGTFGTLHSSHARFNLLSGGDIEGPCLIEPAVSCNHCGYCLSHGH
jgi:hypothetical protein